MIVTLVFAESLDKLFVMYRHGARTTLYPNPKEPDTFSCDTTTLISITGAPNFLNTVYDLQNPQPGNCSLGEILHAGYVQCENIGLYLKEKYPEVNFTKWLNESAYLRTTFTERNMASMKAFLDAMESPNYNIHLADDGIDPLLINKCKFYDRYIEYALTAPEYVAHEQHMKELKTLLNYSDSDSFEWYMAHDELESRRIMRMNLPYGMTEDMKNEIYDMRSLGFKLEYCN